MSVTPLIFGIGVGPGDPSLLTLRAAEVIGRASLVVAPRASADGESVALRIVRAHIAPGCEIVEAAFSMSRSAERRGAATAEVADLLAASAERSKLAVFLTLGDAMLYSTWGYVLAALAERHPGLAVETVPGVTAAAAAAARIGRPLAEGAEPLLFWPVTTPDSLAELLEVAPNIVAFKTGRHLSGLVAAARQANAKVAAASNLGMEGEQVAEDAEELAAAPVGYFTTAIVHKE